MDFIDFKNKMRDEWNKRPISLFDKIKESIYDFIPFIN
jgi:hypothetical protein